MKSGFIFTRDKGKQYKEGREKKYCVLLSFPERRDRETILGELLGELLIRRDCQYIKNKQNVTVTPPIKLYECVYREWGDGLTRGYWSLYYDCSADCPYLKTKDETFLLMPDLRDKYNKHVEEGRAK